MKLSLKNIWIIVVAIAFISSCHREGPADKIEGEYILTENNLKINSAIVDLADYPDATVSLVSEGEEYLSAILHNIVLGYEDFPVQSTVSKNTSSKNEYAFEGETIDANIKIKVAGVVSDGVLTIDVVSENSSAIVGKWSVTSPTLPPFYFSLTPKKGVTTINFGPLALPISTLVQTINTNIVAKISQIDFKYAEFSASSYFNLYIGKTPFVNFLQYYESDGQLHIYVKKSMAEAINSVLKQDGYPIQISSPLDVATKYSIEQGNLNIALDKEMLDPLLLLANMKLQTMTYQEFYGLFGSLLENVTEESFPMYKRAVIDFVSIMLNPEASYEIGLNLSSI